MTTANTFQLDHPSTHGAPVRWLDEINNPVTRRKIERRGIVALGETFERGDWSVDDLESFMRRVFTSPPKLSPLIWAHLLFAAADQRLFNRQSGRGAFAVGRKHYDLGNALFRNMLDESMTYTSGYWANATSLNAAQEAKLDLICRKLDLQPNQRVLDIGCGWGNFAEHAARRYGAQVVGVTVSSAQAEYARNRCAGLPVEIRLQDYREITETFDHIVSIEMIEAVGRKNLPRYFSAIDSALSNHGRCVIQVISGNTLSRTSDRGLDQFILWLVRHIFPNGYLPKVGELTPPPHTSLRIDDWQRFTDDYAQTLRAWRARFNANWPEIAPGYDEQFKRRWNFYLCGCAAAFVVGLVDVGQIVYSKAGPRNRHSTGCPSR